eukprot:tig00020951_g16432.t1
MADAANNEADPGASRTQTDDAEEAERKERGRLAAKKSRLKKKQMFSSLHEENAALRVELEYLRAKAQQTNVTVHHESESQFMRASYEFLSKRLPDMVFASVKNVLHLRKATNASISRVIAELSQIVAPAAAMEIQMWVFRAWVQLKRVGIVPNEPLLVAVNEIDGPKYVNMSPEQLAAYFHHKETCMDRITNAMNNMKTLRRLVSEIQAVGRQLESDTEWYADHAARSIEILPPNQFAHFLRWFEEHNPLLQETVIGHRFSMPAELKQWAAALGKNAPGVVQPQPQPQPHPQPQPQPPPQPQPTLQPQPQPVPSTFAPLGPAPALVVVKAPPNISPAPAPAAAASHAVQSVPSPMPHLSAAAPPAPASPSASAFGPGGGGAPAGVAAPWPPIAVRIPTLGDVIAAQQAQQQAQAQQQIQQMAQAQQIQQLVHMQQQAQQQQQQQQVFAPAPLVVIDRHAALERISPRTHRTSSPRLHISPRADAAAAAAGGGAGRVFDFSPEAIAASAAYQSSMAVDLPAAGPGPGPGSSSGRSTPGAERKRASQEFSPGQGDLPAAQLLPPRPSAPVWSGSAPGPAPAAPPGAGIDPEILRRLIRDAISKEVTQFFQMASTPVPGSGSGSGPPLDPSFGGVSPLRDTSSPLGSSEGHTNSNPDSPPPYEAQTPSLILDHLIAEIPVPPEHAEASLAFATRCMQLGQGQGLPDLR